MYLVKQIQSQSTNIANFPNFTKRSSKYVLVMHHYQRFVHLAESNLKPDNFFKF